MGFFSIKSAYFIEKEIELRGVVETSSRKGASKLWQENWKLRLLNVDLKKKKINGLLAMKYCQLESIYSEER